MSHDLHFLERSLERADRKHLDEAVRLYQEPLRVNYLLHHLKRPNPQQRVALALGEGNAGPYVLLAPDGGFVTCLAAGMSTGEALVVPRTRWEDLSARWRVTTEAILAEQSRPEQVHVLDRVFRTAPVGPCREDLRALMAMMPVMGPEVARLLTGIGQSKEDIEPVLLAGLKLKLPVKAFEEGYQAYADARDAQTVLYGPFAVLLREDGPQEIIEGLPTLSLVILFRGRTLDFLSTAWVAGHVGQRALPVFRKQYREAKVQEDYIVALGSLCAIGLRSRKVRAEVQKLLGSETQPGWSEELRICHQALRSIVGKILQEPDRIRRLADEWRDQLVEALEADAEVAALERAHKEALARNYLLRMEWKEELPVQDALRGLLLLPQAVLEPFENLFLPDELLSKPTRAERIEAGRSAIAQLHEESRIRPVKVQKLPGRNEPCNCGSGRKFKKCCAA